MTGGRPTGVRPATPVAAARVQTGADGAKPLHRAGFGGPRAPRAT